MAKNKKPFNKKNTATNVKTKLAKVESVSKNRKIVKKQEKADEEITMEADGYDSMIENGTSEDSDDSNSMNDETEDVEVFDGEEEEDSDDEDDNEDEDDNDDGDGFSDSEENTAKSVLKPNKLHEKPKRKQTSAGNLAADSSKKVKAPTLDEINELKETRNLFHSNLFRLQVKEMLEEVQVKDKYKNYINKFMEEFKEFVKTLKSSKELEDIDKLSFMIDSKLPIDLAALQINEQKSFQFQFIKPTEEPFFIGACNTNTLLGPKLVADIGLLMPAECFQKENYLNLQYDQKRAYYLAYVAQKLLKTDLIQNLTEEELRFNYHNNNPLKPYLELRPPASAGKAIKQKIVFRLFIGAQENTFKLNRFVPWNNNIRSTLFGDGDDGSSATPLATPAYNANVLFDLTMQSNAKLIAEIFENHKNFQEGLVLLKVWLRQRQLDFGYYGFSAHILAMFMVFLVKQRKLHNNMSSYQVARNVWNHLAFSNWNEPGKGISLCPANSTKANQPTLEQFHTYYKVVFVDSTGFYNICANLTEDMYKRIRLEAKLAVDMLNDMKLNSFQYLFMTKLPLYSQFDHILKINKSDAIEQLLEMHARPSDKYNYAGYTYPQIFNLVTELLKKGLADRIHFILPLETATEPWSINYAPSKAIQHLHLGICLNPEKAYEILNKGPESIDEEAAKFRAFWGERTELRRFQDGSITESVLWAKASDELSKKRLIVRTIVLHLLQHHFQLEEKDVEYIAGEFDAVYKLNKGFKVDKISFKYKIQQDTDVEALSLPVIREFDDLARKLNALKDLPLEIVSIAGISPVLRYCEAQPVLPQARYIQEQLYASQVQYGVIQLGQSGKWPGELAALRALKTAFYIQIATLLNEQHKLLCKVTYDGVLILKQNYCFHLEIAHPKEVGLLKKEKTEKGITQHVDCPESIALEKKHYILPKVTGALRALYQNYNAFGPTVIIAKRWLYSQLIDSGLWPEECTELLIASQFLKTSSQCVTHSPQIGFIRFLQLLANADWKSDLFLINFNNAMEENEISDLEQSFSSQRDTFPPLTIVTAYDQKHYGKIWSTPEQPNVHVLARVTILARQCLEIIENSILTTELFVRPSKIFSASSQGYDLVIQMKPDSIQNSVAFDFGSAFVDFTKPHWHMPLAGANFLQEAVHKLREAYSAYAAFFYNPCGGKEVALIWKPSAFEAKEFKVAEVNGCALLPDEKRIQAKKEIFIEDFKFILKDFYLRMGSVETVKTAAQNSFVQNKSDVFSNNKKRYFEANGKSTAEPPKKKPFMAHYGNSKSLDFKAAKAKPYHPKAHKNSAVQTNGAKTFRPLEDFIKPRRKPFVGKAGNKSQKQPKKLPLPLLTKKNKKVKTSTTN